MTSTGGSNQDNFDAQGINTAIGAAAALLTAVGVSSGVATRMLRNDLGLVIFFVSVMLGALIFALHYRKKMEKWVPAFAFFFVGVVGLTWVAGRTSVAKERPQIFASFETLSHGLVKVSATVKADGLKADELIYVLARGSQRVRVNPVTEEPMESIPEGDSRPIRSVIQEAAFGPNAAGSVDAAFAFEVSPALYQDVIVMASREPDSLLAVRPECFAKHRRSTTEMSKAALGCARFILPLAPRRPVVSASFTDQILTANLSAGGVPHTKVIAVKAWVGSGPPLIDQAVGPDVAGNAKATINVSITQSAPKACVVAALVPSDTHKSVDLITRALCDQTTALPQTVGVAVVETS